MDFVYLDLIILFAVLTWGLVIGCRYLEGKK